LSTSRSREYVDWICRVSTTDQNLDLQRDALKQAGCERIFEEHASGARGDRPELAKALSHARAGDTLVVYKLDRLGRSIRSLIDFTNGLRERKVEFRSVSDGIDTSTPAGRFYFHTLAALAEMERDLIRERVQAGLTAARARGRVGGRKAKLTDKQVAQARKMLDDPSTTISAVAVKMGVNRATIYRSLGLGAFGTTGGNDD
jgi:DNA invertase Pin-like site-specific DNA recombinase